VVRGRVLRVDGLHGETDVGVRHRLAGDDLVRDLNGVVTGDGEADAREALGGGGVERADAHELALRVDERAAGVARVDGRVDLDEVAVDGVAARGLHKLVAIQRGDDALRDGLLETERAADGHDPVADGEVGRVAHLDGRDRVSVEFRLYHGEVGRAVGADDRRLVAVAVDGDADGGGAIDDVIVRDDVTVGVEDDARADAGAVAVGAVHRDDRSGGLGGDGRRRRGVLVGRGYRDRAARAAARGGAGGLRRTDDARGVEAARENRGADDAAENPEQHALARAETVAMHPLAMLAAVLGRRGRSRRGGSRLLRVGLLPGLARLLIGALLPASLLLGVGLLPAALLRLTDLLACPLGVIPGGRRGLPGSASLSGLSRARRGRLSVVRAAPLVAARRWLIGAAGPVGIVIHVVPSSR